MQDTYWLLPDGIEEIKPPKARKLELLRRALLDLFDEKGYEYLMPPPLEFMQALLFKSDEDLEAKTFKVTDRITGDLMGFAPDATPQVAKYDAKYFKNSQEIKRYCYCHQILHTRSHRQLSTRAPLQLGAEIFGNSGIEGDFEAIELMLKVLHKSGFKNLYLDLGHSGIFKHLVEKAGFSDITRQKIFYAIQQKRFDDLNTILQDKNTKEAKLLSDLPHLSGGIEILEKAQKILGNYDAVIDKTLDDLKTLVALISKNKELNLYLDLGELRSYNYHTGIVFAAYVENIGHSLARGGRYDNFCADFGVERAATGFSLDLKFILRSLENLESLENTENTEK